MVRNFNTETKRDMSQNDFRKQKARVRSANPRFVNFTAVKYYSKPHQE